MKKIFLILTFFLTACSSMNSHFDCPIKGGVTCKSLDQVNDMVSRGELGRETSFKKSDIKFASISTMPKSTSPTRENDKIIRMWIAPYQDMQGNYHDEGYLYTVVNKSHWQVPKEVKY